MTTNFLGTVVFDLDGVIYLGSTPIPGAAEAIDELRTMGWQVLFATNNSTKTPESVQRQLLERSGLSVPADSVVTSGMAAARYLAQEGIRTAQVVGSEDLADTVRSAGVSVTDDPEAKAVVVGLDRHLTYGKVDRAARAIRNGARFIATNTDATFPTVDGQAPGAGMVVAAIAAASHDGWIACGKPADPMLQLVNEKVAASRVVMVGDRPETDIAFAATAGWESVLTLTGVTDSVGAATTIHVPDHVVSSVVDLPAILDADTR
ncbi:MAG: HAD-IIA family hydrolase [Actinomycetota bacterium]